MEVRTQQEYNYAILFRGSLRVNRIWLGGTDTLQGREGIWVWLSNDESIDRSRFWAETEPNGGPNEDCLEMNGLGMNDIDCESLFRFVFERA